MSSPPSTDFGIPDAQDADHYRRLEYLFRFEILAKQFPDEHITIDPKGDLGTLKTKYESCIERIKQKWEREERASTAAVCAMILECVAVKKGFDAYTGLALKLISMPDEAQKERTFAFYLGGVTSPGWNEIGEIFIRSGFSQDLLISMHNYMRVNPSTDEVTRIMGLLGGVASSFSRREATWW